MPPWLACRVDHQVGTGCGDLIRRLRVAQFDLAVPEQREIVAVGEGGGKGHAKLPTRAGDHNPHSTPLLTLRSP